MIPVYSPAQYETALRLVSLGVDPLDAAARAGVPYQELLTRARTRSELDLAAWKALGAKEGTRNV